MAVSFRTVGTWAELIADGSVAIPATPQTGDRMYLFARWKDFSVTAQGPVGQLWNKLIEFADGSVSAGNGTGSVKVACWYRDWQSGDTDPTIDFSASPDNASAVIIVMAKEAADSWLAPVAVTAAMTNWTTTSQVVSASSTASVLSGGVVMGLIGIRDDTATMTRPTNGIDDSTGAITWNGNYVEAPATHHSTTTGFDGAADLGYRLVSEGATATLRMTGTISAAETGAALWVVQDVQVNLTVADSAHAHASAGVTLTQVHALTVENVAHAHVATSPVLTQVHVLMISGATHGHSVDSAILVQVHSLIISAANHDHVVENLTVEVAHNLEIDTSSHSHAVESLTIQVVHHLETQHATHAHVSESLSLTQEHVIVVSDASHAHTATSPNVRSTSIVYLDPGGDAVQVTGYFNTVIANGSQISFDSAQQVVGVGSWKFDSGAGNVAPIAGVSGVLGTERRVSFYVRYDEIPDTAAIASGFVSGSTIYSGPSAFVNPELLGADDGLYATATPSKNGSQSSVFRNVGLDAVIPDGATIDSVKIIYKRKYDTDTSIGESSVRCRINSSEDPDHTNGSEPLTDTVVIVDVSSDRAWVRDDLLDGVFELIAEARRGDTDTPHTQSWDYIKIEVGFTFGDPFVETVFVGSSIPYSGGFTSPGSLTANDGIYATAGPARNAAQGTSFGFGAALGSSVPIGALVDSVKIIYEHKYDVNTSIGISRVKWRINGVEGPDHDNTDMPLTDTVVEVDVTGDRGWEQQDLLEGVFEVIAEARRGDTDTAHTQSWDYVKVEVQYHTATEVWSARDGSNNSMFGLSVFQRDTGVSLRLASVTSGGVLSFFDGISELAPATWHRISLAFIENAADDLDFKLFINSILELDITGAATGGFSVVSNMNYGWLNQPGANRVIWFDQIHIDDGMDMEDPGNVRSTAKLPATVNNDNFDTTGGTGAVNERPVSLDNYRQQAATAQVSQDYTIQAASVGDADLSSQTLIGYMGWIIAKKSGFAGTFGFILNGAVTGLSLTTSPALYRLPITDGNYPDDVAGIGLRSPTLSNDSFLYECGIVIAYQPAMVNPNSLLSYQILAQNSITNLTDDLRADPQTSYELCYRIDDGDANVLIMIYSIHHEGQEAQLQGICGGQGGYGRTRIYPGIEVQVSVEVTGGSTGVSVWRRVNVD